MNSALLAQAVATGLAAGAAYALVGLGYALIYRMSGVLNFAHGDLVTGAIFTLLLVAGGGAAVAAGGVAPPLLALGVVAAVVATAAAAVVIQRAAVAPLLARPASLVGVGAGTGWLVTTAAAGLLLRALVGLRFQAESYTVPEVLPLRWLAPSGVVGLPGGGVIPVRAMAVLAVALLVEVVFDRWLGLSRTGRAMRAAADDASGARLCGISPERLQLAAWAIAGALAALAGVLLAPTRPVSPDFGVVLGLKGVAAAVLGGLGSARTTVIAGLALGLGESLLTTMSLGPLGPFPALQDVGPLAVLVLVIALRPGSLGGASGAVD